MFTVKQKLATGDVAVARHFTKWEADEDADRLTRIMGGEYYVEEK